MRSLRIWRGDHVLVLTLMRSTLLGWLLLVLVSAFWPGQSSAMTDAGAPPLVTQGCAAQRLDAAATAVARIASPADATDCGVADGSIADLAGDQLDCLQVMAEPSHATGLPQQAPQSTHRTPASHWPEAPQRPPCPQAA